MNVFHAVILGIVEGLTEFLPVSSTAHLIIVSNFLTFPQDQYLKFFEVFIQSGAILAVLVMFFQYILRYKDLIRKIGISFIPTAFTGFFLYKTIKNIFFESDLLIIDALFTVGIIFLILEYLIASKKIVLEKTISSMSLSDAFTAGLFQALAVVPGVSRSGIVMIYLMAAGYKRSEAALYSFLLAVPTIFAASGYDLYKMRHAFVWSTSNIMFILTGFITSFGVAYLVIRWFIGFLKTNSLIPFAFYRAALAIILLLAS